MLFISQFPILKDLRTKEFPMKTFIILWFIFIFSAEIVYCQKTNNTLLKLKPDFVNTGQLKMSEIISEISYIPLETKPSCLIGYMNIPAFGKDIIIYSHNGENIYRFSDKGKFLNKIGNKGRGPEEYQACTDVLLIGDTVFVVSNFSNDILCYSLTGTFLKKYHINIKARPKSIVQLPDKSFMISLSNPSDFGILLKTDKDFNIKTGFIKNVPLDDNPIVYSFPKSPKKIYYYYTYIDTIYEVSKGYPIPAVIIDYGKYSASKEKHSVDEKHNAILSRPNIYDFRTGLSYLKLSIYYPFKNSTFTILYRIGDGKQFAWTKLINDIDKGTLDKWQGFLSENDLIFWLMPSTIIERFENMTVDEKLDPKNSRFVTMASKISSESNPVIMICKLKL